MKGDNLEILLKNCPSLYKIKIEDNSIDSFDALECLKNYKIQKIYLAGNPITKSNPNYREKLFELVPTLESIDGEDKNGNKVESTIYGGEEDDEELEEGEDGLYEGEDDGEGNYEDEEDEDDEGDDEDDEDDDEEKPHKKSKE